MTPTLDTPQANRRLAHVERISTLLDSAVRIPGTKWTVGIDPILGIVPGVGDALSLSVSLYLIYQARQLGVPRKTQVRMLATVGIDALVGSVPIVGQLADFAIKANARNVKLLERYLDEQQSTPEDAAQ